MDGGSSTATDHIEYGHIISTKLSQKGIKEEDEKEAEWNESDFGPISSCLTQKCGEIMENYDEWNEAGAGPGRYCIQGENEMELQNEDWSPCAVSSLLTSWDEKYNAVDKRKLTTKHWCQVSAEVSARCGGTKQAKGALQCRQKVKSLKKRYYREKVGNKDFPRSSWEWYDLLDANLGDTPKNNVAGLDRPAIDDEQIESTTSGHESNRSGDLEEERPSMEGVRAHFHVTLPKEEEEALFHNQKGGLRTRTTKLFPKERPSPAITPRSESNFCLKQKRRPTAPSDKETEKQVLDNRSTKSVIAAILRVAGNPTLRKRKGECSSRRFPEEPNIVSALIAFGAMVQQLEKSQMAMIDRVMLEQSQALSDFVKTLKQNDQVNSRQTSVVLLAVRFLLSVAVIGMFLMGFTKNLKSDWGANSQAQDLFGKMQELSGGHVAWLGCFVTLIVAQLAWLPFKRR